MAFPYEFHENFESGDRGSFDSELDDGTRLDFPHQTDLPPGMMPARGAFCCRVNLGKNSDPAYLEKAVTWPSVTQRWGRFHLFIGEDVQFGNDLDYVRIIQFYSSGPTKEARLTLGRVEPFGTVLAAEMEGETWDVGRSYFKVPVGRWFVPEFRRRVDSDIAGAGSMALLHSDAGNLVSDRRVEGDNTAFRFGAVEQQGDIHGTLYFDNLIIDEDRLYDDPSPINGALSGGSLFMVQSGFAFLGQGELEHITVIDGGSGDCRVKVYDTDYPTRLPAGGLRYDIVAPTAGGTAQSTSNRVPFRRGAYVQLSGTNPQAIVRLGTVASDRAPKT